MHSTGWSSPLSHVFVGEPRGRYLTLCWITWTHHSLSVQRLFLAAERLLIGTHVRSLSVRLTLWRTPPLYTSHMYTVSGAHVSCGKWAADCIVTSLTSQRCNPVRHTLRNDDCTERRGGGGEGRKGGGGGPWPWDRLLWTMRSGFHLRWTDNSALWNLICEAILKVHCVVVEKILQSEEKDVHRPICLMPKKTK